ncbi:MAG: hypothetical protein JWQ33_956, partial [Ramlibacter sp.]|nr:hypothetical protein [Ramlibacter sp.]
GKRLGPDTATVGEGEVIAQARTAPGFHSIVVDGPAELVYTAGTRAALVVRAQRNILALLATRVDEGVLRISFTRSAIMPAYPRIEASSETLGALTLSSGGSVRLNGLHGESLRLELTGSGDVLADGEVRNVSMRSTGSGDINASQLRARRLQVALAGSGAVTAQAQDAADVDSAGSGDVVVAGNPARRKVVRRGSGQVRFD